MTSEFLRAECRSPKLEEFIINVDFLIEIKKVSVQYFYLTSLTPFPNRIRYLLLNCYNYALPCATAPVFSSFLIATPIFTEDFLVWTTCGSPHAFLVASFYARYHTPDVAQ